MGLSAKYHQWTRAPGGADICFPCGKYAHENPGIECAAYCPDWDPEVLRKQIETLKSELSAAVQAEREAVISILKEELGEEFDGSLYKRDIAKLFDRIRNR